MSQPIPIYLLLLWGYSVTHVLDALRRYLEGRGYYFPMGSSGFFIYLFLPVAHAPAIQSFHKINVYQGYLTGVRRPVGKAYNITIFMSRFCSNSGNLKLLEP